MNIERLFTQNHLDILQKARSTYGPHKQIGVAAEECTELAKELIKSFRYDDFNDAVSNTKENVIDEVADILIVLDHVFKLYNITTSDLIPSIDRKIDRLGFWLSHSSTSEFTTEHRSLRDIQTIQKDREKLPYDALGDYTELTKKLFVQNGAEEKCSIRLFETGDQQYRETME